SYNWSNGDSTQMTYAKATGMYSVEVTDTNGCSAEDSVFVSIINGNILQNDTTICKGDSVLLSISQPLGQALTVCNGNNLPSNLQTGLVGYWPFCGNANDESGNGNNGTVNGATLITDRFGNANSAYDFDGNDWIQVPHNNSINFDNTDSYSILIWYKQGIYTSGQSIIEKWESSSPSYPYIIRTSQNGSRIDLIAAAYDGTAIQNSVKLTTLPNSDWNQVVVVYSNYVNKLYHNGILIDSSNIRLSSFSNNIDLFIGRRGSTNNRFFHGKLDDMAIWNRALSQVEIQQLYTPNYSSSYSWSTGDTTSSISVSPDSTTTYYVIISNGINSCVDSVTVTVNNPQFQFAQDTITSCGQDSVLLNAGVGFASYNWSNGDSTQMTYAKSTGMYSVEVTDTNGCSAEDSVFVSIINGNILQNDTIICKGDSVLLSISQPIGQALTICNGNNLPSNLQTGLVGYWPFCGNANDESGNGNNGTVNGATQTTDRFGNANSAYDFDGVNDYITIGAMNGIAGASSHTMLFWIKTSLFGCNGQQIITNFNGPAITNRSLHYGFRGCDPVLCPSGHCMGMDTYNTQFFTQTILDTNWSLWAFTFDTSNLIRKIYQNGVLVDSNIANSAYQGSLNLIFGSLKFSGFPQGGYFNGQLDDVGIWNRTLSVKEVQQLYTPNYSVSYSWSTGDTTSTISVSPDSTTTYYVTISNGIHSCVDSVTVTVNNPKVQFAQDTITSCNQDSMLLDAGVGFTSYNWSNGDSTQTTYAKATGMYSVQVSDSNGCSAEDSVFASIINGNILQNDTTICKGDSVSLSVGTFSSSTLTACNGNNLPSNLQTGLVGYWPFCGNANDESGNGNNGTVNGATLTTDRFGNANSAYDFDGVNDYLDFGNPTLLNPTPFSYSQSCWIKLVDYSAIQDPILSKRHQDNGNDWATALIKSDGKVSFFSDDKQHYTTNFATSPVLDSSFWYQFTFVKNGYSYIMYMNGYLVDSIYDTHIMGGTNDNFIAGKQGAWNAFFKGKIDDIGIWNRALSSSEAQQLYSNGAQQTYQWSTGDTTSSILVSPDSTTTYYVTISNGIHSCVDSVTVTVNNPQFQFAQDSVSGCDTVTVNAGAGWSTYTWSSGDTTQSVSFTTTGMKVLTVTDSIGCAATDSIYVTVNTYVTTTMGDTSCDQYTWLQTGITYTMTGTYSDTIPTAVGCDSIIVLDLTINVSDTVRIPTIACDSFTWSQTGLTYYTSGVYSDSLVNNQGCDSILLLDLTITQATSSTISAAACDSFTWLLNGMTYNSSGVYSDTITNSQGCDSIVSLNLTINTLSYQLPQDTITSCNQDSVLLDAGTGFTTYNWSNGDSTQTSYVSATGMYSVQVSDSNGCSASDSVFVSIINDTILQNDTTICKGDSISLSVGIPQPTNLLIDSITIRMDSVWDYYFTSLDTTRNYLLKVNGLWANCCGHLNYDVAFGGITWSSISPVIWNSSAIYFHMDGLPFPRPTPDVYSTSHQYDYPLSPSKDSIEISFYDNPTTDNIGALRFRLFQLIDPSSLTHQWSNGDTASSISVSPDSTTTYYVTISNGIHSCVDSVTVTVNNPQ
ncbi:LamG domain-containing protein, partial [Flavobacteriales bacterium]|nr:LamG domain-containing protein [Flavobacteriales bacterium]